MKKQIVHKSAAPLYATAVVWVLYALLFPLYKPVHFLIAIAASALVGVIAYRERIGFDGIAGIFLLLCAVAVLSLPGKK